MGVAHQRHARDSSISPAISQHTQRRGMSSQTTSARDSFWSIPPIQDAIAPHLNRIDFWNCCQTSKSLHAAFIPFLWETVQPQNNTQTALFFTSATQSSYRHHVKELLFNTMNSSPLASSTETFLVFPNLTKMTFTFVDKTTLDTLIKFVDLHASLQILEITQEQDCYLSLWNIAHFLRRRIDSPLKEFVLDLSASYDCLSVAQILANARGLERLVIKVDAMPNHTGTEWQFVSFKESKIKHLNLRTYRGYLDELLIRLLQSCPRLETLYLHDLELLDSNRWTLSMGAQCLDLRELVLSYSSVTTEGLTAILNGCRGMRKLVAAMPGNNQTTIAAICRNHGKTLEYLDLGGNDFILIEEFSLIVQSCSALEVFQGRVQWFTRETFDGDAMLEGKRAPWVCSRLLTLGLYLYKVEPLDGATDVDWFFQQMGTLTLLETLSFSVYTGDRLFSELFVSRLGYLSSLGNLHDLQFPDCRSSPLNPLQVEVMVRQWPRLEFFRGLLSPKFRDSGKEMVASIRARLLESGGDDGFAVEGGVE